MLIPLQSVNNVSLWHYENTEHCCLFKNPAVQHSNTGSTNSVSLGQDYLNVQPIRDRECSDDLFENSHCFSLFIFLFVYFLVCWLFSFKYWHSHSHSLKFHFSYLRKIYMVFQVVHSAHIKEKLAENILTLRSSKM